MEKGITEMQLSRSEDKWKVITYTAKISKYNAVIKRIVHIKGEAENTEVSITLDKFQIGTIRREILALDPEALL